MKIYFVEEWRADMRVAVVEEWRAELLVAEVEEWRADRKVARVEEWRADKKVALVPEWRAGGVASAAVGRGGTARKTWSDFHPFFWILNPYVWAAIGVFGGLVTGFIGFRVLGIESGYVLLTQWFLPPILWLVGAGVATSRYREYKATVKK